MSDEAKPEGGKDAYTRDTMQTLGRMIDENIPDKWGFALLVFPHAGEPGRTNYVANGDRAGVVAEMKGLIERWEKDGSDIGFFKHHEQGKEILFIDFWNNWAKGKCPVTPGTGLERWAQRIWEAGIQEGYAREHDKEKRV